MLFFHSKDFSFKSPCEIKWRFYSKLSYNMKKSLRNKDRKDGFLRKTLCGKKEFSIGLDLKHMYIYIIIYIHVYIYIYVYVCVYTHIYVYVMYICFFIYLLSKYPYTILVSGYINYTQYTNFFHLTLSIDLSLIHIYLSYIDVTRHQYGIRVF